MCANSHPRVSAVLMCVALLAIGQATHAGEAELIGRRIVAIELHCDAPIDREGLMRLLPMHVGGELRAADVDGAQQRLAHTELFRTVRVGVEARGDAVAVVAQLARKPVVNAIRFRRNRAVGDDELRRRVPLRENMPLTDELREYAVRRIRDFYVEQGFDEAQVVAETVERGAGEVDVVFDIDEGEPLRVGAVVIDGEVPVAREALRAAVAIREGDRHRRAQQRAAQAAIVSVLRGKQYYEAEVTSRWERAEGKTGTLRFTVSSGPPFVVTFAGNRHFSDQAVFALMDLAKRPIITDGTWRELARRAQRAYREDGYSFARVEVQIAAGTPKRVRFGVTEGDAFHVGAVRFEGNRGLAAGALRKVMATQPPAWFPWRKGVFLDETFDDDLKRLWYLYRRHGYQTAQIVDARVHFDPDTHHVFPTVVIDEGRQIIVRTVERRGVELVADALPELQLARGEALDPEQVEADRRALLAAFAQAGYGQAEVQVDVSTEVAGDTEAATVRFTAVPGERQQVGAIIVQHNLDTRARVITREMPFRSGDPLNPDALLRGQSNVYRLGLFRSVTVRPAETAAEPGRRDVTISVAEKPPGSLQWGAGYNTRDGFRGFFEVGYDNLQGLARRVSLRGDVTLDPGDTSPNEYIGNAGFREPRLFDTRWAFRSNLIAQRSTRSVDQFSLERLALIPAVERTLLPGLQAGVEMQLEQSQVFNVAADVVDFNPRDAGRLRTVSLGPFAVYDGRDDAFVPRRGVFDSLRVRYAPGGLGSEVPFVKVLGQHTHYIPIDDDIGVVYVARGGWARASEGEDEVPIRERFFLGGRTTVRGFGENEIGPRGAHRFDARGRDLGGGHLLGGDLVMNLNAELRFPLVYGLGGAVFADGGGLYLQDRAISVHDFRRSTGIGLRYLTPVGPVSLECGFKLDRRADESLGEIHFSIGTIF